VAANRDEFETAVVRTSTSTSCWMRCGPAGRPPGRLGGRDGRGSGSKAISPTAHYTGHAWTRNALSDSAPLEGRALFGALEPVDSEGQALDGSNGYELRLQPPPPVDALWSLTMYDVPDFYLVASPRPRLMGDRTPGLRYDDDRSVTLFMSKDSPGRDKVSNWLPAPDGPFRQFLRMHQPHEEILADTYELPAIT
jgi:hypothetical protein